MITRTKWQLLIFLAQNLPTSFRMEAQSARNPESSWFLVVDCRVKPGNDGLSEGSVFGLIYFERRSRKGKFLLGRKPARSRMSRAIRSIRVWLQKAVYLDTPQQVVKRMNRKLEGHYRHFGVGGNYESLHKLWYEAQRLLFKEINRRSQKRTYNWEQFSRFLKYNPLATPKIHHTYVQLAAR
jgi:hypothetical protein